MFERFQLNSNMMEWKIFLYYCYFCTVHDVKAKNYKDFFDDRQAVAMMLKSYFHFIREHSPDLLK